MAFGPIANSRTSQAVTGTASGITASAIPNSANYAEGAVKTAAIVETREGTTATTAIGYPWNAGDMVFLRSRDEITQFSAIRSTSTSATIDWQFFNQRPAGMR